MLSIGTYRLTTELNYVPGLISNIHSRKINHIADNWHTPEHRTSIEHRQGGHQLSVDNWALGIFWTFHVLMYSIYAFVFRWKFCEKWQLQLHNSPKTCWKSITGQGELGWENHRNYSKQNIYRLKQFRSIWNILRHQTAFTITCCTRKKVEPWSLKVY